MMVYVNYKKVSSTWVLDIFLFRMSNILQEVLSLVFCVIEQK